MEDIPSNHLGCIKPWCRICMGSGWVCPQANFINMCSWDFPLGSFFGSFLPRILFHRVGQRGAQRRHLFFDSTVLAQWSWNGITIFLGGGFQTQCKYVFGGNFDWIFPPKIIFLHEVWVGVIDHDLIFVRFFHDVFHSWRFGDARTGSTLLDFIMSSVLLSWKHRAMSWSSKEPKWGQMWTCSSRFFFPRFFLTFLKRYPLVAME